MARLVYPQLPLDGLLRRAAVRNPSGCALRTGAGPGGRSVTFAELDAEADRFAGYLEHACGRRGARVGTANTLTPVFAAAYYGTARSGNTVVLVNPLIKEAGLAHVFAAAAVEVAFVPAATAELLVKLRDRLPALTTVVVTDAPDAVVPGDCLPLAAVLDRAPVPAARLLDTGPGPGPGPGPGLDLGPGPGLDLGPGLGLDEDVCIQFTTGTTGRPKGVRLTHRNLVANAAQIAAAHRLDGDSVTLNHLPLYHVMHLNSAVYAGACQVLATDPDPVASLALAAETAATHYYGLPARLHALARDRRPVGPVPRSLTAVLSGGTALAPAAARALTDRLGVPVVQGYGMAELSPLSHCQDPRSPKSGSVGPVVPGTECRVVDLESRRPLEVFATGEVQVRGPQVMAGYLDDGSGAAGPSPVDADGWFSTGDVGYQTEDGVLFLVDRLGDVFKYDNELVSPSAVEAVVSDDPRVAECIVAGWPDAVHGAVVWLGIVLRDPAAEGLLDVLDSVVDAANGRLAPFEQIRRVEVIDAVPRNHVGKPDRRELRRGIRGRASAEAGA
ncbi:class I adenylate-forming enzyme family protein [Streptomyces sp. NBC_00503]|uniref:class I adenylate-forming enzyme family protein n=1 Tax=Streptomyces sp. NBC_00503 TaxID=2903659 RepID=UPI002E811BF8|nr:class I adenylate-forming enzyme family protein [Streptomyces sp. NBC_00503]WUD86573.1 acyl--CoA ligase [Streptomyces sp. NBC_00503]